MEPVLSNALAEITINQQPRVSFHSRPHLLPRKTVFFFREALDKFSCSCVSSQSSTAEGQSNQGSWQVTF